MGYLCFLQMADIAAEASPLITLLHGHRHGHFHAVCRVPVQIASTTSDTLIHHVPLLTLAGFSTSRGMAHRRQTSPR